MEEFNTIANVSSEKPIETISTWKTNNKLYYIAIWLLSLSLVISVYFVNNNYQKNQLLSEEITKLSTDITAKNTTIVSLNDNISKLNTEIQKLNTEILSLKNIDKSITQATDVAATDLFGKTKVSIDTESDPLTNYLKRWRDTARSAGMKEVSTALAAYMIDNAALPEIPTSGCVPWKELQTKRVLVKIPVDPIEWRYSSGCDGSDGMSYAYRVYNQSWTPIAILGTELENEIWGNSAISIDEVMKLEDPIKYIDESQKWAWKYYIIRN